MSHATVMCLGPKTERELEDMLDPYNEEIQVDPYWEPAGDWSLGQREEGESLEDLAIRLTNEDETYAVRNGELVYESTYNPKSKWDWWVIGGRWRGYLPLKLDATGKLGHPGVFDNESMRENGADIARLGDIDWLQMEAEALDRANEVIDKVTGLLGGRPLPELPPSGSSREVWQEWWNHPNVAAIKVEAGFMTGPADLKRIAEQPDSFREEQRLMARACFATLAPEVGWLEPGRMGWFGMSSDNADDRISYARKVNDLLDTLPEDTMVWIVDYHI